MERFVMRRNNELIPVLPVAAWIAICKKVMRRDGYKCIVASCSVRGISNLTVHHVVPRSEGGSSHETNLVTLCRIHHDEIELADIRLRCFIENWSGPQDDEDLSMLTMTERKNTPIRNTTSALEAGTEMSCVVCGRLKHLATAIQYTAEEDGIDGYLCERCGIEQVQRSEPSVTRVFVPDVLPDGWVYLFLSRRAKTGGEKPSKNGVAATEGASHCAT